MDPSVTAQAHSILGLYGLQNSDLIPIATGLINLTVLVESSEGRFILQRVNPVFPATIHADIAAVTLALTERELATPQLLPNHEGKLYCELDGEVWRLLSYVPGRTIELVSVPAQARSAGALLARFHGAVWTLQHTFGTTRAGVHDTPRHMRNLQDSLSRQHAHPRHADVLALASDIFDYTADIPPLPPVKDRIVHGDPKISNVLFESDSDNALCMVDLDTLGPNPLPFELGDAFRSWCNPNGEDCATSFFSLEIFEAAAEGYAGSAPADMDSAEWHACVHGTESILLELAARFCADALDEQYFGWDPSRFESRGEHNYVRAASQLSAARSLREQRADADRIVRKYSPV